MNGLRLHRKQSLASSLRRAGVMLTIIAAWSCGHDMDALAAPADSPQQAEAAGWQASDAPQNPFRAAEPEQWSPSRNHLRNRPAPDESNKQLAGAAVKDDAAPPRPAASPPRWMLPNQPAATADSEARGNGKVAAATADAASTASASKDAAPHEPRPFKPASNAVTLPAGGSAARTSKPTGSAAVASAAAARPKNSPINQQAARTNSPPNSRFIGPSPAGYAGVGGMGNRHAHHSRTAPDSYAGRLWKNVTVAFQTPETWGDEFEPEALPMPGGGFDMGHAYGGPYVTSPGDCSDGSCEMHGEPGCGCPSGCGDACGCGCGGNCGGDCGCGGAYGCGDGLEPGCACEPGCDCGGHGAGCDCGCGGLCLGWGDSESCHTIRIRVPKWQEFTVFGGVQGFKGPYDRFRDRGNFGFNEGFNVGFKLPYTKMGYQIGYRATHSQLSGDEQTESSDPHTQQFVTIGVFRRAKDGLMGGLAWDMLRDERYGARSFNQVRGELSLIERGCHEWGAAVAVHLNDEVFRDDDDREVFQASDQYLLFYRFHSHRGGEGRFYAGLNDDSDGIIGADTLLPLTDRWSLAAGFTYLIPEEASGEEGASHEAWNIGLGLVWHWDCRARRSHANCYRPLFNVADNGYLIVDER